MSEPTPATPRLCPACQTPIYRYIPRCPNCDAPTPETWKPGAGWTVGKSAVALLLTLLILLSAFIGLAAGNIVLGSVFGGLGGGWLGWLLAGISVALLVVCLWGTRALRRSVQRGND